MPGFKLHRKPNDAPGGSELDGLRRTNKENICVWDGNISGYWFAIGQKQLVTLAEGMELLGPLMVTEVTTVELYVITPSDPGTTK